MIKEVCLKLLKIMLPISGYSDVFYPPVPNSSATATAPATAKGGGGAAARMMTVEARIAAANAEADAAGRPWRRDPSQQGAHSF